MNTSIINIGDEILIGQIENTNAKYLAENLSTFGFEIKNIEVVGDNYTDIISVLDKHSKNFDLTIVTGGLGPTKDDVTKQACIDFFGGELIFFNEVYSNIETLFANRNLKVSKTNKQQAFLPNTCTPLKNELGTASGMIFLKEKWNCIFLPGVPFEMKNIFETSLKQFILNNYELGNIYQKHIVTTGIAESNLSDKLEKWENKLKNQGFLLAYLPSPGYVKLRITSLNMLKQDFENKTTDLINEIFNIIPENIINTTGESIEETLGYELNKQNITISTAESCTGGKIASQIVSIAGSSNYFNGSIVAYSNKIKTELLNVPENILNKYGAVSQQTVEIMAISVSEIFKTNCSIAVSGIAGPGGDSEFKPLGCVWIATKFNENILSKQYLFGIGRDRVIQRASIAAMHQLLTMIKKIKK